MAKVKIIIIDGADDKVSVKIESRPSFPGPAAKDQTLTNAQIAALKAMETIMEVFAKD